jgi:hypothetical protein
MTEIKKLCKLARGKKFTLDQTMKAQRESRDTLSLTLAPEAGERLTTHFGHFCPRERPDNHCTGG